MNSAQIGLVILMVIAFCMVVTCEVTIYIMRRFFRFLDNKRSDKKKIAELEEKLKARTDKAHADALKGDVSDEK